MIDQLPVCFCSFVFKNGLIALIKSSLIKLNLYFKNRLNWEIVHQDIEVSQFDSIALNKAYIVGVSV